MNSTYFSLPAYYKIKGNPELVFVFNLILGKNALFPALLLVRISTSNIFLNKPRHNNCVPLHRPYLGSMFRNNIKGAYFFTFKIFGGILPWAIEFKNSYWYKLWASPSISSNDNKLCSSLGNWLIIISFNFWTSSFVCVIMTLSTIYTASHPCKCNCGKKYDQ